MPITLTGANDVFTLANTDTLYGGAGDDSLTAQSNLSLVLANLDNDTLVSSGFQNTLGGGQGDDSLSTTTVLNLLVGAAGEDTLFAGENSSSVTLRGGADDDTLESVGDSNQLFGVAGDDSLFASGDNNTLLGDDGVGGSDTLQASGTGNTLIGGGGTDTLLSSGSENILFGGTEEDSLETTGTGDTLLGNIGSDTLIAGSGATAALLGGGQDDDFLDASLAGAEDTTITLIGAQGADTLVGSAFNDLLRGGIDNDSLVGGEGDDTIFGVDGDDTLVGGEDSDSLVGDAGTDDFLFNTAPTTGVDTISAFEVGVDDILLDAGTFTAFTTTGQLSADQFAIVNSMMSAGSSSALIAYNISDGALYYNANGAAGGGAVQFASLDENLGLSSGDFEIGLFGGTTTDPVINGGGQ